MDRGAPLTVLQNYRLLADPESGQLMLTRYKDGEDHEILGPLVQAALLVGRKGDEVLVSGAGRLHVIQASGLPQYWLDADANADDSYYNLGVATKDCTYCSIYVETNDAIISFDGGVTDHFFLDKDAGQVLLAGLDIPKGSTISGKNAVAAADYTNLRIAVW